MAELQSLYRSRMRLFKDRLDVTVWGRWYWCPPDAKRVPFAHSFGSSRYVPDFAKERVTLGEVWEQFEITNDEANPRFTGQNVCGSADVWLNGTLYEDRGLPAADWDGVPICCSALPEPPGGAECGGESDQGVVVGFAFDEGYDVGYDAPD